MKKFGVKFLAVLAVFALLITAGCESLFNGGYKKTESGIKYKVINKNNPDTTSVRVGSVISLSMSYGLKDSVIFDSKDIPDDIRFPVVESQYEGDFYEAVRLFHQGDSVNFIIKAGPFFTKTVGQPSLPPGFTEDDDLYFTIRFIKVQSQTEIMAEEAAMMETMKNEEENIIRNFIAQKAITVAANPSGIYFIEKKKGTGKSPVKDDYVSAHFIVSRLTGEQIFSTYEQNEPVDFQFGSRFENLGFQEAVAMMRVGGTAQALVPSSMAFGAQGAGDIIAPFTPLFYDLELVNVMSKGEWDKKQAVKAAQKQADDARLEKEEARLLQKYLKESGITTPALPSGLIYIERQKGTGPKADAGMRVQVHYTGKLLDGSIFDSSYDVGQPYEFVLGRKGVIAGWEEGIALMNEGGKATLVIPSKLAYKDRGAGGGRIPPFASLVFDVELVKVTAE